MPRYPDTKLNYWAKKTRFEAIRALGIAGRNDADITGLLEYLIRTPFGDNEYSKVEFQILTTQALVISENGKAKLKELEAELHNNPQALCIARRAIEPEGGCEPLQRK